ncbi:MAG: MATE family efflux transporter [Pilosibacter sp.]
MPRPQGGRKTNIDMTEGVIWKQLVLFAIPLIMGNVFQQLYNTVDSIVVGNYLGTSALAAVGATTAICNTLVNFFNGISIGAKRGDQYEFWREKPQEASRGGGDDDPLRGDRRMFCLPDLYRGRSGDVKVDVHAG